MMVSCLGYYCNETGLGFSTCVFYKTFGPRVWIGDDPLPTPSVYDTKDRLKKRACSVVVYPKTLRVLAQSVAEHVQVKTERVRIVQKTLMPQEFLPTLKNPRPSFNSG